MIQSAATSTRDDRAGRRSVPVRTCVGCRARLPRVELVRTSRRSDGCVVPAGRRAVGRSAYLCPRWACFERALRRRAIERSLRGPRSLATSVDARRLWPSVLEGIERQIEVLRRTGAGSQSDRLTVLVALHERLTEPGEVA